MSFDEESPEKGMVVVEIDDAIFKEGSPTHELSHDDIYAIYTKYMKEYLEDTDAQKQNMQNKKMLEKLFAE